MGRRDPVLASILVTLSLGGCGAHPQPYTVWGGRDALCPGKPGCDFAVLEEPPTKPYSDGLALTLNVDVRDEPSLRTLIQDAVCEADGEAVIVERSAEDGRYLSVTVIRFYPPEVRSDGRPCLGTEPMFQSREQCPHAWGEATPKTFSSVRSNESRLSICSFTVGAAVSVDGEAVGRTPILLHVSPGEHDVEVTLGGTSWRREVVVHNNEELRLTVPP